MSNGIYNLMDAFFPAQAGQVAAGATTASIPVAGKTYIPSAWKGGYMYFVNGAAKGQFASITDNTATTFTVTGLTAAPAEGDVFVLYSVPPGNIEQVGGQSVPVLDIPRVPVVGYNQQIPGPSTTTTLGPNGTYTSQAVATAGFARITGSVFANAPGTLNVQQSPDGTNWDVVSTFSVSANTGLGFSVELVCLNVRLDYINGSSSQTVFRLYSFLRRFS